MELHVRLRADLLARVDRYTAGLRGRLPRGAVVTRSDAVLVLLMMALDQVDAEVAARGTVSAAGASRTSLTTRYWR